MAKLVASRRNPPEEPSRSLLSRSSSKPTNFSLPRPQTQQTIRSPTMTMVSASGSPQSRPNTSAQSISRTAYAPLQAKPYRIRPSSAAGLLNERHSVEHKHIPITPIKGQKRPIKIVPVPPAPLLAEDRHDYGWEHTPTQADSKRSSSGLGLAPVTEKPQTVTQTKKRWSASGAFSRWLKWAKPMSTSKATAAHVEAYLKQQRDYEAQRIAEENQPPIQLPDTAVAGTTIAGHRYIAISIPYDASPFSPPKQPPQRPRKGPVARLHAPPRPPSRPMTSQAPPEVLSAVSRPVYSPSSMDSQPFLPPITRKLTAIATSATTINTASTTTSPTAMTSPTAINSAPDITNPTPISHTTANSTTTTTIPSPTESTESDSTSTAASNESGSESGSNSCTDSVTTASTSARAETPQLASQPSQVSQPPQRPTMVPRRSTSILTQMTQQSASGTSTPRSGIISPTAVPRRRTATVTGNMRSGTDSIDGVLLASPQPLTPLSTLTPLSLLFPQPISPASLLCQPSAYPRPLGPIPDIPPIAAQKAKLAELQAARKAAEREEAERAAASAKAAKRRSLPMRTRQQENAAKLAPISITSEPLTSMSPGGTKRRDSKLAAPPFPSPVPESPMDPMAFSDQRRSRQERVRERKMRDIQRARSSRERGSISSMDSSLDSPPLSPSGSVSIVGSSSPKMSTVMLIAEVIPAETPGATASRGSVPSKTTSSRYNSAREKLSRRRHSHTHGASASTTTSDNESRPGSAGESVADSLAGFEPSREQLRDMERRLRRLERSTTDAVVKALAPALANLDRTLMTLYEGRVVEWVSEAAEKRRSRIMMDTVEGASNPRTPESSIFTDRSYRMSK